MAEGRGVLKSEIGSGKWEFGLRQAQARQRRKKIEGERLRSWEGEKVRGSGNAEVRKKGHSALGRGHSGKS